MQVHRDRAAFRKLGVQTVVIGHSSLRYAKAFVADTGIDLPVYVDEGRVLYQALGFKRPILTALHPRMFKRASEARREGFTQAGVHGDAFQLGGVVLRMPDASMPFKYASEFAGDHPRLEDLKEEVAKAVRARRAR